MIKKYIRLMKENKNSFFLFSIVKIGIDILNLLIPIYSSKIIDAFTNKELNSSIKLIIILAILFLMSNFCSYLTYRFYSLFYSKTYRTTHKKIVHRIYDFNSNELIAMQKGKILNTVSKDLVAIGEAASYFLNIILNIVLILIILILFIKISFILFLILMIIIISYILWAKKLSHKSAFYLKEQRNYGDKLTDLMNQTMRGIREIKTFNMYDSLDTKFESLRKEWSKKYLLKRKYLIAYTVNLKYLKYISKIFLYTISLLLIFEDKISTGIFLLIITYFENIFNYAHDFVINYGTILEYKVSIDRIYDLIYSTKRKEESKTIIKKDILGNIKFKNVYFRYKENLILKNISFESKPNQITVIAGKTGSGKTTIFNILLRLYQKEKGQVFIDDMSITALDKKTYSRYISVVNQESFLFNMSIKENLSLITKNTKKQIEVCKRVGIHDVIMKLPNKYDTVLSENANNLSGGQKRLLSLAKTLLMETKIILFDEVTSSLDLNTTNKIIHVLKELKKDHTLIIITHKEEIMKIADNLIVLEKGNIVKQGTYEEIRHNLYLINKSASKIEIES